MRKGRPRTYRHDVRCPDCGSNWCKKNGRQNNKQRYRCNECGRVFTPVASRKKHPREVKELALKMLSEGMGISAVARTLGLPEGTVSCWLHREGKRLEEINEKKLEKKRKEKGLEGVDSFSFDEMWTYVGARRGEKRNSKYIWTAVIGDGKEEIFTFEVGERDEGTFLKVVGENTEG
ncbi:MAG: helix-turn-helix domain-containing protein [Desulfurobacteriaceae bacterium]